MTHARANDLRLPRSERQRTSGLLRELRAELPDARVRLGDIAARLGDRGFGLLLVLFAAPNLVPLPIPGLTTILGLPLVVVSAQLLFGRASPWLPRRLAERTVARDELDRALAWAEARLTRLERALGPRWPLLSTPLAERLLGGLCLALATLVTLPILFGNLLPALAVLVIGLGLVERDGRVIAAGVALGIVAFVVVAGFLAAIAGIAAHLIGELYR